MKAWLIDNEKGVTLKVKKMLASAHSFYLKA